MKQRFLNQKLGKRVSRKAGLEKARIAAARRSPGSKFAGTNRTAGKPG